MSESTSVQPPQTIVVNNDRPTANVFALALVVIAALAAIVVWHRDELKFEAMSTQPMYEDQYYETAQPPVFNAPFNMNSSMSIPLAMSDLTRGMMICVITPSGIDLAQSGEVTDIGFNEHGYLQITINGQYGFVVTYPNAIGMGYNVDGTYTQAGPCMK